MSNVQGVVDEFKSLSHEFELFMEAVGGLFLKHPKIATDPFPIVHSIRKRIKNEQHLREKLGRKLLRATK
jgi:putative GTP pyrophosphokinase